MICKNCGKEIQEGMMFCPGCGSLADDGTEEAGPAAEAVKESPDPGYAQSVVSEPVAGTLQGNVSKKSPVPWIIAGVAAVVLVAAAVIVAAVVAAGAYVSRNNVQSPAGQGENTIADTGSDDTSGDGTDTGEDTAGDTGSDVDTGTGSGTLPDGSGSGLNTKDDVDVLEKYFKDELIADKGIFDMDQSVELSYYEAMNGGYVSPAYKSFDNSVEGIMTYKIADFDNDMRSEMLVVSIEHSTVWLEIYEVGDLSHVSLSKSLPLSIIGGEVDIASALGQICGDVQELNICINEYGNEKYIAVDCMGVCCLFADGIENTLYITHYDGRAFVEDFNESFCGSDDSGMEDSASMCRSRLLELGFENTAYSFTYLSMQLADEKGMERLVGMRGENPLVYEAYSEANNYYDTNDINCLGTIKYLFAEGGRVTHKRFESAYAADYHSIKNNSEYILPGSDSRYYTMDELAGLTAEECRLARNELFARHGRKFQDEALQAYFDSLSWYHGTIEPEDFDESIFNEYEVANRDLIVQYEKDMGYR